MSFLVKSVNLGWADLSSNSDSTTDQPDEFEHMT